MKTRFLFVLMFLCQGLFAADSAIVFRQINYKELFAVAAKEHKMVMLYFHFDGCGACAQMEKEVFNQPEVAKFFNDSFVCFGVNIYKGEGRETNKIYNVRLCPSFIFLDEKGEEVHKITGSHKPYELISQGKAALEGTSGFTGMNRRYFNGDRSAEFLYKYCYMLRDADHENEKVLNEYIATQSLADLEQEKNLRFLYDFSVFKGSNIAFPVNSREYLFMKDHIALFTPYFEEEQVCARLYFMASNKVYQAALDSDEVAFNTALEELKFYDGKQYDYKNHRGNTVMWSEDKHAVLKSQLFFYEKTRNRGMYDKTLAAYIEKAWSEDEALNSMAWSFYERTNDQKYLKQAVKWAKRAVELNPNYANTDTYAALLFKTADYKNAELQAKRSIEIGLKAKQNVAETEALLKKIGEAKAKK